MWLILYYTVKINTRNHSSALPLKNKWQIFENIQMSSMISYIYIWAYFEIANIKSTYPSMRNCPGAGRPTWMESFNRSSSAAQLSTKLVTGILKDRDRWNDNKTSISLRYSPFSFYLTILLSDIVKSTFILTLWFFI